MIIRRAVAKDMEHCFEIRRRVFIEEQKVPEELELDDYDKTALHFIALDGPVPVATARVLIKDEGSTAKIGRVAVMKAARGLGIGLKLMQEIEAWIAQSPELGNVKSFMLEAQTHAVPFYDKLGYKAQGDEFMDAGIPHYRMQKPVTRKGT